MYNNTVQELQTAEQIVRRILEKNPLCRDNDKELFIAYLQESGMGLTTFQADLIRQLLSFESLRRTRQHVQNDLGELSASPTVKKHRVKKEIEIREHLMTRQAQPVYGIAQDGKRVLVGWR